MLRPVAPPSARRSLLRLTYELDNPHHGSHKACQMTSKPEGSARCALLPHMWARAHTRRSQQCHSTLLLSSEPQPPLQKKLCRSELNTINKMSSACTHKAEDGLKLAEFIDTQSSSCNIIMNGSFFSAEWISSKTVSATWLDLSNGWLWEWVILCYSYYWHKSGAAGWHAVVLL